MKEMQTTFVMIKPDGVQRGLVANIIGRFETKGLRLVGLRQITPSMDLAEAHYAVHKERPFYAGLIEFITSGPVVAMAWTGVDAISVARNIIGPTDGRVAAPTVKIQLSSNSAFGSRMVLWTGLETLRSISMSNRSIQQRKYHGMVL